MPRDAAKRMKSERRWCYVNPEGRIVDGIMYSRRGQALVEYRLNGFLTERIAMVRITEITRPSTYTPRDKSKPHAT